MTWTREEAWIGLFTGAYLLAALVGAMTGGNSEFVYYIVVMLVLIAAVLAVHRRVRFRAAVLAGLSLWGAAHMAGGLLPVGDSVLYNFWLIPERLKYDQVVHALGFGLTTWVCWEAMRPSLREMRPRTGPLVLCAAAGCGFGAFNEVVEFIAVLTIPNTNVGGYENTGWDLIANLVGSVSAALLIARFDRRG